MNQSEAAMARVEVADRGNAVAFVCGRVGGRPTGRFGGPHFIGGWHGDRDGHGDEFMQIANSAYMGLIYSETLARMGLGMGAGYG